ENLLANPECDVQVGTKKFSARARTIEGDDRDQIWAMMEKIYPPYIDYQARTDRKIPVVVLDPV
ncbi:MAG: nitroreductase/quinone reductase family protein, partial [Proteobacteria bacterium]|nr:nitroreductase/quinone reductase family protein [Pseudomonadota bacterium]